MAEINETEQGINEVTEHLDVIRALIKMGKKYIDTDDCSEQLKGKYEILLYQEKLLTETLIILTSEALKKEEIIQSKTPLAKYLEKQTDPVAWFGGACPIENETRVKVWHRSGTEFVGTIPFPAATNWEHDISHKDIIAYQVLK